MITNQSKIKSELSKLEPKSEFEKLYDYKKFYGDAKPFIWYSYQKTLNTQNITFKNLYVELDIAGCLSSSFKIRLRPPFTIILVADKHKYTNNDIINFGTTDRYHCFGWYNKNRNYIYVNGKIRNATPVKQYEGTDLIFLSSFNSQNTPTISHFFYYSLFKLELLIQKKDSYEFQFNPKDIKIYEIMIFQDVLLSSKMGEIEIFLKKFYPNILYKVEI